MLFVVFCLFVVFYFFQNLISLGNRGAGVSEFSKRFNKRKNSHKDQRPRKDTDPVKDNGLVEDRPRYVIAANAPLTSPPTYEYIIRLRNFFFFD